MIAKSRLAKPWFAMLAMFLWSVCVSASHAASGDILGPGDSLRITVFQNPDLSSETRISAQGTVRMPLIGVIELSGLSAEDAGQLIARRLRDGSIINDPEVVVSLMQVRSKLVSVLGHVARPGRYPLDETSNQLLEVLAQAGGIANGGDDRVRVLTKRDGKPVKLDINLTTLLGGNDPAANIELGNGDTVFVQPAPVFYIYGEIQRAGAYRLEDDLTVIQAMSLGGGVTRRGTERGLRIHRRGVDGALARMEAKPYDKVQADDVIYVNESLF
jgi:polysaccharide biosynthesis/export protein